jgi:hypothetical protein
MLPSLWIPITFLFPFRNIGLPEDPFCVLAKWVNSFELSLFIFIILPLAFFICLNPGNWGINISLPTKLLLS